MQFNSQSPNKINYSARKEEYHSASPSMVEGSSRLPALHSERQERLEGIKALQEREEKVEARGFQASVMSVSSKGEPSVRMSDGYAEPIMSPKLSATHMMQRSSHLEIIEGGGSDEEDKTG